MSSLPGAVIIGTQKAATTFLQHAVGEHPEAVAIMGECRFFEESADPEEIAGKFDGIWPDHAEGKVRVIKRAEYLGRPEVPKRLAGTIPNALLICVLRDPVDRALSAYYHHIRYGNLPVEHHEVGLTEILNGRWAEKYPKSSSVLEYGNYGEQLKRYLDFFSREQILCFRFEEFREAPEKVIKKLYCFLGLDDAIVLKNPSRKRQAVNYSLKRLRLLSWRNKVCFSKNSQEQRLRSSLLAKGVWYGTEGFDRYVLSRAFPCHRPILSKGLRERLREYFKEEIKSAELLMSLDLSGWYEQNSP